MTFRDGFQNLIEDVYRREREREKEVVLNIENTNHAIARYGESIRKICREFCKRVGYELKVHEHIENSQGLRFYKVKEVDLTLYLGRKGHYVIIVESRGDYILIYPNTDVKFDEIRLSLANFSEEKLAESLKTTYKQLMG